MGGSAPPEYHRHHMAEMLAAPMFHHLHLNSVDPDAAIAFYTRVFPSTSPTTWAGLPALASPNSVLILINRVTTPPPAAPETAYWHFGWHVPHAHERMEELRGQHGLNLLPLYTGAGAAAVFISSDTWPAHPGTLGRTKREVEEAQASGIEPRRQGGFAYLRGPDGALVELAGDFETEFFNHVHMFHEHPFCAQLWYQQHLHAMPMARRVLPESVTEGNCRVERGPDATFPSLVPTGTYRTPAAGVAFGDVTLPSYMPQGNQPLAGTRGQLCDHIALSVENLDAWMDKLKAEGVGFLEQQYRLGDTRAVMIEGPSHEAIELVEILTPLP